MCTPPARLNYNLYIGRGPGVDNVVVVLLVVGRNRPNGLTCGPTFLTAIVTSYTQQQSSASRKALLCLQGRYGAVESRL